MDVDGRPGDGNQKFLSRPVRHLLDVGDAANRQQRDVAGAYPEATRHQHMAEFMCEHAGEDRENEQNRLDCRVATALGAGDYAEPCQEEEKGNVDPDFRSGDAAQWK